MTKRVLNPNISIDCVLFGFDFEKLHVLLIDRGGDQDDQGDDVKRFALPGDLIYNDEDLNSGAQRVLKDLTGLDNIFLEQFGAFGDPKRLSDERDRRWLKSLRSHPEERVVTIGYYSLVKMRDYHPVASSFAQSVRWLPINEVGELAFDHNCIFSQALTSLRNTLQTRPIGFNLLPPKFTLGQLQKLYEAIHDKELDKRNFRRKILKLGIVKELEEKQKGVAHKPARFFAFDKDKYEELQEEGFENFKL
ncbi:MAG: NUDIX hydrolase [Flavobacteriales bacterium]|nr:NUDIX hydrolase [Flavobacteriales bacterium]